MNTDSQHRHCFTNLERNGFGTVTKQACSCGIVRQKKSSRVEWLYFFVKNQKLVSESLEEIENSMHLKREEDSLSSSGEQNG